MDPRLRKIVIDTSRRSTRCTAAQGRTGSDWIQVVKSRNPRRRSRTGRPTLGSDCKWINGSREDRKRESKNKRIQRSHRETEQDEADHQSQNRRSVRPSRLPRPLVLPRNSRLSPNPFHFRRGQLSGELLTNNAEKSRRKCCIALVTCLLVEKSILFHSKTKPPAAVQNGNGRRGTTQQRRKKTRGEPEESQKTNNKSPFPQRKARVETRGQNPTSIIRVSKKLWYETNKIPKNVSSALFHPFQVHSVTPFFFSGMDLVFLLLPLIHFFFLVEFSSRLSLNNDLMSSGCT